MIVLDTNVVSELQKRPYESAFWAWARSSEADRLWLCAPVVSELAYGAKRAALRHGRTRHESDLTRMITDDFSDRILPFDTASALRSGRLRAERQSVGRTVPFVDGMIAAICLTHGATLATRNVRDFADFGLELINPFDPDG